MVSGEYMGRFLYFENQTPEETAPVIFFTEDDDAACFIDTALTASNQDGLLIRTIKKAWFAVASMLR
jgi:hypothetical protein